MPTSTRCAATASAFSSAAATRAWSSAATALTCCTSSPSRTHGWTGRRHRKGPNAMTRPEKCEAILVKMLDLANEGRPVRLAAEDWGGLAATLGVGDRHTHVGD